MMLMTPRVWVGRVKDGLHPFLSEMLMMYEDTQLNDPYHDLLLPLHILVALRGKNKSDKKKLSNLWFKVCCLSLFRRPCVVVFLPVVFTAMLEPIAL